MEIKWEINDGYAGKSRSQTTRIDDCDLEGYETEEEKEAFISECVQEDFMNRISWYEVSRYEDD